MKEEKDQLGPVDVGSWLRDENFNTPFTRMEVYIHVFWTFDPWPRVHCDIIMTEG